MFGDNVRRPTDLDSFLGVDVSDVLPFQLTLNLVNQSTVTIYVIRPAVYGLWGKLHVLNMLRIKRG